MDAPEPASFLAQHSLLGHSRCQIPLWEPGPGRGSTESAQARAVSPNKSQPTEAGRGARSPAARTCGATEPRRAPTPLPSGSLPFPWTPLVLPWAVRAEIGSPRNSGEKRRCEHIRTKPTPRCVCGSGHAHTPARPAGPAPPGLSALGRDPRLRTSARDKPCPAASPGPVTQRGTAGQGSPERVGRGGRSGPQTGGGGVIRLASLDRSLDRCSCASRGRSPWGRGPEGRAGSW